RRGPWGAYWYGWACTCAPGTGSPKSSVTRTAITPPCGSARSTSSRRSPSASTMKSVTSVGRRWPYCSVTQPGGDDGVSSGRELGELEPALVVSDRGTPRCSRNAERDLCPAQRYAGLRGNDPAANAPGPGLRRARAQTRHARERCACG